MTGLINLGSGLSAMGQGIADVGSQGLKNSFDAQKMVLASQLEGKQYDVAAKRMALIPQAVSMDAYLKAVGHPGGLSDFGVNMSGMSSGDGASAPQQAPSAPANNGVAGMAQDVGGAPAGNSGPYNGGSAPSGGGNAPSNGGAGNSSSSGSSGGGVSDKAAAAFPKGAPIVTPIGDKGKVLGVPLPPGWTPAMAQIAGPTALSAAWEKFSSPGAIRPGGAIPFFNFNTGKMETLYQQPNTPMGSLYDPTTKSYVRIGNADDAISSAAYNTSRGTSQGSLPADLTKIGATGAQQRGTEAFKTQLENANTLVPKYDQAQGRTVMVTRGDALAMANGGTPMTTTPVAGDAGSGQSKVGLQKDGSYRTSSGTTIPAPPKLPARQAGLQQGPSAADKATQSVYDETIKGWQDSVEPSTFAEQRMLAIADAMKATQTGAWAETKQDIAHKLMQYGVLSPDAANKLLGADVGQAQITLKNNFGAALNVLSGTKGLSRFTQNELFATQKTMPGIGLQPEANLAIMAQAIGAARFQRHMAADWNTARQIGYNDPLAFRDAWIDANPIQGFIDQAKGEIGPLKGMADTHAPSGLPMPKVGTVQQGYTFMGGDPANSDNWKQNP